MDMEMGFSLLSFAAPALAVVIGGLVMLGLDWWWRR